MSGIRGIWFSLWRLLMRWFDGYEETGMVYDSESKQMDRVRTIPFFFMHIAVFTVFWVGWSPVAISTAVLLYVTRMFAFIGASAAQRGPLWWAANHRVHHSRSDQPADVHSPLHHGLWWSHRAGS